MKRFAISVLSLLLFCALLLGQTDINPNGFNSLYHPNGKLLSEGLLKDGKPEGYWKTYYPTGVIKAEGNRKNFKLDSVWIFYNSIGDTTTKINYLEGSKNGYYYEYYTNRSLPDFLGNVKSKELYVVDKLEGVSRYYYPNGTIRKTINYSNNLAEGQSIEYADDGRIITVLRYRKGSIIERRKINRYDGSNLKIGEWIEYYGDLRVKTEANYKKDLLNGYYKEYNESGKLRLTLLYRDGKLVEEVKQDNIEVDIRERKLTNGKIVRGPYVDDIPVGIHNTLDSEGNILASKIYDDYGVMLSEGLIDKEGKRRGAWKDFYANGNIRAEGEYKNNFREGTWRFYYGNAKLEQEGVFRKGKEQGEWRRYFANGEIHIEENYYQGREDGFYSEYLNNGLLIVQGEFIEGEKEGEWLLEINDFKATGKFITGLRDGKWKYFYDDGSILFEGQYIQGNPDGKHKYYYPDGNLKEEQYFSGGIPNKHWKKYDEEGNLIVTISYQGGREYRINGVKIDFEEDNKVIIK